MSCTKDTRRGQKNKTHCFSDNDEKYFFMQALVIEGFIAVTPAQSNGAQGTQCVLAELSGLTSGVVYLRVKIFSACS
jgi:hypothetical protein